MEENVNVYNEEIEEPILEPDEVDQESEEPVLEPGEVDQESEELISESDEVIEDLEEQNVYESIDYTPQLQTLIELHTTNNALLAQNNANQLFVIGTMSALIVILVLYKAFKKFI